MRILLLNPNTSEAITERLTSAARRAAAPGTVIVPLTAPRGVPYIATRAEAQIGGAIALEMLAEHHRDFDAAIIAAFGDPGLFGARELFDLPVIGLAEASMLTACMLGRRFAIVTFARALGPWYEDCVDMHGLAGRCAGVRMLDESFVSVSDVQEENEELLVKLANRAVTEDGADVVILGGAPLAGLADKVRDRIPVPVVDQMAAAIKQAEALAVLNTRNRRNVPPPRREADHRVGRSLGASHRASRLILIFRNFAFHGRESILYSAPSRLFRRGVSRSSRT